jgi:hypothetical protein
MHSLLREFAVIPQEHPGGTNPIMKVAGRDGTEPFSAVHPKDLIRYRISLVYHRVLVILLFITF